MLTQALWVNIWKRTVEKNQTNANDVTIHNLKLAIWGHICKHTLEKSQTNAEHTKKNTKRKTQGIPVLMYIGCKQCPFCSCPQMLKFDYCVKLKLRLRKRSTMWKCVFGFTKLTQRLYHFNWMRTPNCLNCLEFLLHHTLKMQRMRFTSCNAKMCKFRMPS